ncbi:MAG: asparaginase [Methylococcaceae bacterium]
MKNILAVFTGGTIGSKATDGTIKPSGQGAFKLLELFQRHYPDYQQISFRTIQPMQILSENMAPAAWKMLIDAIESEQPRHYDGIIITHGTDTLAYTAAALSFYFAAIKIPMLLVSSDYPLDDPKANGLDNLICAVEFIRQIQTAGIFVPYRNQHQSSLLHRGVHLTSSLQLSSDFFSIQGKSYMEFVARQFSLLYPDRVKAADNNLNSDRQQPPEPFRLIADFSDRILMIKPYPGLNYDNFNLDRVDAVLHDLYHSGTACASTQWGNRHSLLEFLKRCRESRVKAYLAPAIKSPDAYQTTRALIAEGAEMIWDMSIEAAYVKLMLAYGNFKDEQQIIQFIATDIAGEHI